MLLVRFGTGLATVLVLAAPALAQDPAPPKPAFEVASIKLEPNCGGGKGMNRFPTPGRLNIPCTTVEELIQGAYVIFANGPVPNLVQIQVIGGPSWTRTDRYSVNAKAEDGAAVDRMFGPMLQALLEDRFQLKLHRDSKETPVYALTAPAGAGKLKPTPEGSCVPIDLNHLPEPGSAERPKFCGAQSMRNVNGRSLNMSINGVSMGELARGALSNLLDRPVVDHSGLTGRFDIEMEFVGDSSLKMFQGRPTPSADGGLPAAPDGPNIFMALERLGLKLERVKAPVEVLVIDRLERPTAN